jgi:hypothetical protein
MTIHVYTCIVPRLRMSGTTTALHHMLSWSCTGTTLPLLLDTENRPIISFRAKIAIFAESMVIGE